MNIVLFGPAMKLIECFVGITGDIVDRSTEGCYAGDQLLECVISLPPPDQKSGRGITAEKQQK